MPDPSAGEVGGIFAGVMAGLAMIGAAIKWAVGWDERRETSRAAKLDAWHKELEAREDAVDRRQADHVAAIEVQLGAMAQWALQLDRELAAVRSGYQILAAAMRVESPENPALRHADEILKSAFSLDPVVPASLMSLLAKIAPHPGS